MRRFFLASSMLLLLMTATLARAGTVVWDFDSTDTLTSDLPEGAVDGDMLAPNINNFSWGPDPINGTINANFSTAGGQLKQTYQALTSNQLPPHWSAVAMTLGRVSVWPGTAGIPDLGLENAQTDYRYLIIKGTVGWSTNKDVGVYIFPSMVQGFGNGGCYATLKTNSDERQVIDLPGLTNNGGSANGYTGTLRGFGFLWYANLWGAYNGQPTEPDYMQAQWPAEFDNNPSVTYVNFDWVALTDNVDFRADVEPTPTPDLTAIRWDFDGDTPDLPAGIIDGDSLVQWGPDPFTGTVNADFSIAEGKLRQTYGALAEGAMPANMHDTASHVGVIATGIGSATPLNLAAIETNYKYLILKGTVGWSTDKPVGARLYPIIQGKNWYDVPITLDYVATNSDSRQVFDLSSYAGYDGEMDGLLIDWYGIWHPEFFAPTYMKDQWIAEFDNDPAVTYLNLDWIALANDPDYGLEGGQVTRSRDWVQYE